MEGMKEVKGEETYVSARTIRVLEAFSIVNFVFPSCPAIRPTQSKYNISDRPTLSQDSRGNAPIARER